MKEKLYILWTNDNIFTTEKMVFLYARNSLLKKWWDDVTIIVWGATAKLIAENASIRNTIKTMMDDGVKFSACKACADQLEVTPVLEDLGIEIKYWGESLTELIKGPEKLITI